MYFVSFLFLFSAYNYLNTCPVCSGPVVLVFSFNEVLYLSKKISNHDNINCKYLSWFGIVSQSDECIICKDWMGNVEIFVYQIHCATWLKTPSTALEINLLKASITKTKKNECIIWKNQMGTVEEIIVYQIHCETWLKTPSIALEINLLAFITKMKRSGDNVST